MSEDIELLAKLREPFPAHHISKLPKETKSQADARKADKSLIVWKCQVCGGAHHKDAVHLDYVGHAALTDRLLDTDMAWNWEPVAFDDRGLPAFDQQGGLWIRLTVHGVTRLGYGSAAHKPHMEVGAREKEVIGDALRNAAMRFGAALDLWHKGDLHLVEEEKPVEANKPQPRQKLDGPYETKTALKKAADSFYRDLIGCGDSDMLEALLAMDDSKALVDQLKRDWPGYLTGEGMPGDFEPMYTVVKRLRHEFGGSN